MILRKLLRSKKGVVLETVFAIVMIVATVYGAIETIQAGFKFIIADNSTNESFDSSICPDLIEQIDQPNMILFEKQSLADARGFPLSEKCTKK